MNDDRCENNFNTNTIVATKMANIERGNLQNTRLRFNINRHQNIEDTSRGAWRCETHQFSATSDDQKIIFVPSTTSKGGLGHFSF